MIFSEPYFAYSDVGEKHSYNTSFLSYEEATALNKEKYAIAIIPNIVVGGRHNANVTKIRAWFCDIDYTGPKPALDDLLQLSPLIPSFVVESKNGFHIYFLSSYQFTPDSDYVREQEGIIDFFGADVKCKNVARLMRAPGFTHNKSEPFEVKIVFESSAKYSRGQIETWFPLAEIENSEDFKTSATVANSDNTFDKIRHYNSRVILQALSGTGAVGFKNYRFKPTGRGHFNIFVDGKDSGCFINDKGNVIGTGEYSGGAVEWLTFYGHTRLNAAKEICGVMGWEFKA